MKGIRFFHTIQVKLIIIYVLLILVAMQLIGIYFIKTMEESFINNFDASLNKQLNLLAEYVKPYLGGNASNMQAEEYTVENLHDVVDNFNKISGAEIQVIDANAVVLSSSASTLPQNDQKEYKNTQTEITQALQGYREIKWDAVDGFGVRKRAMATPVMDGGKVIGAVYLVASLEEVFATIDRIKQIFIVGTLIALALTAVLGVILSGTITSPIKDITLKATAMAEGNFNQKVKVSSQDEIGQLGFAFNYMTNRLKEALSANEEEKEKLASVLSNMSDGVIAADNHGEIIVINRRAGEILRKKANTENEQDNITDLLEMPLQKIREYAQGSQNTALLDYYADDESEPIKVRASFTPIHRRDKGVIGTIVVLQDVTEQEKLEQLRREFVANVSHELRTPLTTINSYLEALDDGALEEPQLAKRFISVIRNETERMIRLVTDLLHLSRFDNKQAVIQKEPTVIVEMLEEVADRFSFQLQQRKISIELDVEKGVHMALLDPDQIDQVLDNLVSNGIKYTPAGGKIRISAGLSDRDWIKITVEDSGVGIPEKDQERIFERFFRVDKARSRDMGGTGLGLSIAREIVKAHGGYITLESKVNVGTRVTFTVPRWVPEAKGSRAI